VTASSGDNTVAVFTNIDRGIFCEIKQVVDNNATGVRTVVAADLDGDGWLDLASASKDDHSVAWYPNNGSGWFMEKNIISAGEESKGAYSLVAADIDNDGDNDLIVASNGNDHVSLWRNDGKGEFTKTLIYGNADFVLSVTAVDFDRDGDLDVASASFFDGFIRWYENVDGGGKEWKNHTVFVGPRGDDGGHYVSHADMDGDGDADLIAVTHAENTVRVFLAQTDCDNLKSASCCAGGTEWNGTACVACSKGKYGVGVGTAAKCEPCPAGPAACHIPSRSVVPATCSGITGCATNTSISACACPVDFAKDKDSDACARCPDGQERKAQVERTVDSLGNYTAWELQQGLCRPVQLAERYDYRPLIIGLSVLAVLAVAGLYLVWRRHVALVESDAVWTINEEDISYSTPVTILGKGTFGVVSQGSYRGTAVAVKKAIPQNVKKGEDRAEASGLNSVNTGMGSKDLHTSSLSGFGSAPRELGSNASAMFSGSGAKGLSRSRLRQEFKHEMRILAKLRHPCITTVMGAVLSDDPLLVMECMSNGSLRDLLSNQTFPLDPELSLPLLRDILQGMRFLHAADPPILHGDLKSANVLVDQNYRAKISDFGLSAKRRHGYVGTPFWMAPELLKGSLTSRESDVYAFGITLWEVMTRNIPYAELELTFQEILDQISAGTLRPDCREGLDTELVQCMQDCWAQDPSQRVTFEDLEIKIIPLCGQNFFSVMEKRHAHTRRQSSLLDMHILCHIIIRICHIIIHIQKRHAHTRRQSSLLDMYVYDDVTYAYDDVT